MKLFIHKLQFLLRFEILVFSFLLLSTQISIFAQSDDNMQNPTVTKEIPPERDREESVREERSEEEDEDKKKKKIKKSKGFYKGKMSIELKGGFGTNAKYDPNIESVRSEIDELLFEYGVSDRFGIGFSLHHQKYIYKSKLLEFGRLSEIADTLYLLNLFGSSGGIFNLLLLSSLNDSLKNDSTITFSSTSLDFTPSFHFLKRKAWDPFIRGNIGFGTIGGRDLGGSANYIHLGVGGGTRYYFRHWFFLVGEINLNVYSVLGITLRENNVQMGIGFSF